MANAAISAGAEGKRGVQMAWLTWRQHRAEGLIVLVVLAVIGVFLLMTGFEMANSFQQLGLSNCLISKNSSCGELEMAFRIVQAGPLLALALALLLGGLVCAPLATGELDQRTPLP